MPFLATWEVPGTGQLVYLREQPLQVFNRYKQEGIDSKEAGGILLGHVRGEHLEIIEATEPSFWDRRFRFLFERMPYFHHKLAMKRWKESNGLVRYIGEWHTHPQNHPTPSSIDITEWQDEQGRILWALRSPYERWQRRRRCVRAEPNAGPRGQAFGREPKFVDMGFAQPVRAQNGLPLAVEHRAAVTGDLPGRTAKARCACIGCGGAQLFGQPVGQIDPVSSAARAIRENGRDPPGAPRRPLRCFSGRRVRVSSPPPSFFRPTQGFAVRPGL